MPHSRPYTTHQTYNSFHELLRDRREDACKTIANTDHSKSADWVTPIMAKYARDPEWKEAIHKHARLRKLENAWIQTAESLQEATKDFAASLNEINVTEDSHRDIESLICLFKGLYARGVWLDNSSKWEAGQDPLEQGNRERVRGGKRERIYAHLWEASLQLENKINQFLMSNQASAVLSTTATFGEILKEDEISLSSLSVQSREMKELEPSENSSASSSEPKEASLEQKPFESERAHLLDQMLTFRIIELMGHRDQLSGQGKDQTRRALLDKLIDTLTLHLTTLSLPGLPDKMVNTLEDSLSRVLKTYIKDFSKLNLFHAKTGPEIALLQIIRNDLKYSSEPLALHQTTENESKKPRHGT